MTISVSQYQFESDKWKRLLEFIILENTYCKNRLSDIVKESDNSDSEFLEQAEHYQYYYIQQETLLSLLRSDIYAFDRLLEKEKFFDGRIAKKANEQRKIIYQEIEKLTIEYQKGAKRFNDFLEAHSKT